jgi:hypothetical protein
MKALTSHSKEGFALATEQQDRLDDVIGELEEVTSVTTILSHMPANFDIGGGSSYYIKAMALVDRQLAHIEGELKRLSRQSEAAR